MRQTARIALTLVLTVLGLVPALFSLAGGQAAASHRDAPRISGDPMADNTDLYAFISPDKPGTVTVIANFYPFQDPAGEPTSYAFADDVHYNLRFDNNADGVADLTYQFRFSTEVRDPKTLLYNTGQIESLESANWNVRQVYSLFQVDIDNKSQQLAEGLIVPPVNLGPLSTPNYDDLASAAVSTVDDLTVFAGQRDDPFFADLGALSDLLSIRSFPGNAGGGSDAMAGMNVQTIAMQIPFNRLTSDGSTPTQQGDAKATIGIWADTTRQANLTLKSDGTRSTSGGFVQVSRVGNPLFSELVLPIGVRDRYNSSYPVDDEQFLASVRTPELPKLLGVRYGMKVPTGERNDLVLLFLTGLQGLNHPPNVVPGDEIRVNLTVPPAATPDRLSVLVNDLSGFPNGRRLADDVVDVELRIFAGAIPGGELNVAPNNQLGDGVDTNDVPFLNQFPYVAPPHASFGQRAASATETSTGAATPAVEEPVAATAVEETAVPTPLEAATAVATPGVAEETVVTTTEAADETVVATPEAVEETVVPNPTAEQATAPTARTATIQLQEINNSGISGTAVLTAEGQKTLVSITGQGTNGGNPVHIHRGTCDNLDPDPLIPLRDIDQNGRSETTVPITFDELINGTYSINVHKSAAEIGVYVMCGETTGGGT